MAEPSWHSRQVGLSAQLLTVWLLDDHRSQIPYIAVVTATLSQDESFYAPKFVANFELKGDADIIRDWSMTDALQASNPPMTFVHRTFTTVIKGVCLVCSGEHCRHDLLQTVPKCGAKLHRWRFRCEQPYDICRSADEAAVCVRANACLRHGSRS